MLNLQPGLRDSCAALLAATCLLACACSEPGALRPVESSKLNAEEQGNLDYLRPRIASVLREVEEILAADAQLAEAQKTGDPEEEQKYLNRRGTSLASIKAHLIEISKADPEPRLEAAQALVGLNKAIQEYEALGAQMSPGAATSSEKELILARVIAVHEANSAFEEMIADRDPIPSAMGFEPRLAAQLGPLHVDVLSQEVTVKHSVAFGPVKVSAGMKSVDRAIDTLIVRDEVSQRIFAVGDRSIEVRVPYSVIRTDGNVMTVTALREEEMGLPGPFLPPRPGRYAPIEQDTEPAESTD
ncbi:MAG: hypothetical protein AAGB51_07040 [Planctomycetota bacterium]